MGYDGFKKECKITKSILLWANNFDVSDLAMPEGRLLNVGEGNFTLKE
jgi:hypothetical protein